MESSKRNSINLFFILLFLFIGQSILNAQNEYESENDYQFQTLKKSKERKVSHFSNTKPVAFKIGVFFPEVGVEVELAKKFSLDIATRLGIRGYIQATNTNFNVKLFPYPVFHVEPKWNYNVIRRSELGKKTKNFSSNFLSLYTSYHIKVSPNTYHMLLVGPTWGMQRLLGNFGYFKLNTGIGYVHVFDASSIPPSPTGQIRLPISIILDLRLGFMF